MPTADLVDRQRLVLSELRSRLGLEELDERLEQLPPEQLRQVVDKAVGQVRRALITTLFSSRDLRLFTVLLRELSSHSHSSALRLAHRDWRTGGALERMSAD